MPLVRSPGGSVVAGSRWLDSIGPRDERPRTSERAWHAEEPSRVGTDRLSACCRALNTDPYVYATMGTSTTDEDQARVEYPNGTGSEAAPRSPCHSAVLS